MALKINKRGGFVETLFENQFTRDAEWAKDYCGYVYFRRPAAIVFSVLAALYLVWGVYDLVVNRVINLCIFFPIFWVVMTTLLYRKNSKLTLKRDFEMHGRAIETITTVTNKDIEISQSTGARYRIRFADIKKVVETKKYIYLWSKTNTFYSMKKDGFSVGNGEELRIFLRNKGIR